MLFQLRYLIYSLITARIAKRAKVMFSQAFVCPTEGGQVGNQGPGHNTSLPLLCTTTPPPPPEPGHNTSLPPWTTPPPPPPLGPGHNTSPPPPLGPGHNTSPPPFWDQVTTPRPSLPPDYAQAGGMHPTGMHSCLKYVSTLILKSAVRDILNVFPKMFFGLLDIDFSLTQYHIGNVFKKFSPYFMFLY